jgi:hypothetical protein
MIFERNLELAAERAHAFVACADPFAAEFADEIGILREAERMYAPAVSRAGFENRHVPVGALQGVSGGETGETRADDDAGTFRAASLGLRRRTVEQKGHAERGCAEGFDEVATCRLSFFSVHRSFRVSRVEESP